MDKDRNNMIEDMFEYYDNAPDDDVGNTRVLSSSSLDEKVTDDTIIMSTDDEYITVNSVTEDMGNTTYIPTTDTNGRPAPVEEILGNMDLSGRVIPVAPPQYQRRTSSPDIDPDNVRRPSRRRPEAVAMRPTSLWYKLKPLWATIMACIVLVGAFKFYITDNGIIGTYKRNFSYNMSLILRTLGVDTNKATDEEMDEIEEFEKFIGASNPVTDFFTATGLSITAYAEGEDDSRPRYDDNYKVKSSVPFPGAANATFCKYQNGVVCAKANYICYITSDGDIKWEYSTPISQPILSVDGKYIALAGEDSTQLILYKDGKEVFSTEVNDNIKKCSVSKKGDVALVTEKTAYKGAVCVYNSKGEEVFSWISGVNYITSATMLKNRTVSVALVSTEDNLKSYVMIFDIYSSEPMGGSEFSGTLIYDTSAHKNITYAYGDNSLSAVKSNGETKYNILFDNMAITHTAEDENGWRIVSYTDNHLPYINVYKPSGKMRYCIPIEASPEHIDINESFVLYSKGRDIICGKANDSTKTNYQAPMTVKDLIMLDKNLYMVVYENSLEFIKI